MSRNVFVAALFFASMSLAHAASMLDKVKSTHVLSYGIIKEDSTTLSSMRMAIAPPLTLISAKPSQLPFWAMAPVSP